MATYSLAIGAGVFKHAGFSVSMPGVMYAVIVAGRVTEVHFGELPESDESTLYIDVDAYETLPSVDDYFSEICQTFSSIPPYIPPGDIAPPYPPGTTPPIPGTPEYPTGPSDPGPPALASTMPVLIVFQADATDPLTIAAVPGALTEVDPKLRTAFDLAGTCAVRVQAHVVDPSSGADLVVQYSDDNGTTWYPLSSGGTGPRCTLSAAGDVQGLFVNVASGAQGDVLLSLFTENGDEGTDAVLGNVSMIVYAKTGAGSCVELEEETPDAGCELVHGTYGWTDLDYADVEAWNAAMSPDIMTQQAPSTTANSYIDPTDLFDGKPCIVMNYDGVDDWAFKSAKPTPDVTTAQAVIARIDASLALGSSEPFIIAKLIPSGTVDELGFWITDGRIYGGVIGSSGTDFGSATDIVGAKKKIAFIAGNANATSTGASARLFITNSCDVMTEYAQVLGQGGGFQLGHIFFPDSLGGSFWFEYPAGGSITGEVRMWQFTNAEPFDLGA